MPEPPKNFMGPDLAKNPRPDPLLTIRKGAFWPQGRPRHHGRPPRRRGLPHLAMLEQRHPMKVVAFALVGLGLSILAPLAFRAAWQARGVGSP